MQLNHINNKPTLTASQLQQNCYYRFLNLPNYIFIFDKNYPYELMPVVNNDSELKDDYHRFKDQYLNHLQQPIEIITLDNISFNIQTKNTYYRKDVFNEYIKDKKGFITLFYSNRTYPFMFFTINDQLISYNLDNNNPIPEITPSINSLNTCFFKQITINSIDYKSIDNSKIYLFTGKQYNPITV